MSTNVGIEWKGNEDYSVLVDFEDGGGGFVIFDCGVYDGFVSFLI